ncbi:alpha-L-arabinofuranosidase C-terminal domain-containing protein [Massilibacteroides vaginae]|uniref:alpha-L-arabinofuranosidase C-terminal domain-containing protein n=1 Tax=Massilibacteroides vaginae TaxID=1673718 RepID=UPI000A1CD801|nr:alpha-L-arabinofuranosidase C-terminal domain-containing protein [Massilibacteroides vaginae]
MSGNTMYFSFVQKILYSWLILSITSCVPDIPPTSTISIDMEATPALVNSDLYGLNVEEINHAIEGGLYAELIQNRSFEDGVLPVHSAYDRARGVLITPNRWTLAFPRPDSVPGWRRLADNTCFSPDITTPLSEKNRRYLSVYVNYSEGKRGGLIAEGYKGISLKKGERYNLSFYIRSTSQMPKNITIALEDSTCSRLLSDAFEVTPSYEWKQFRHVFTATEDATHALLTISAMESAYFNIDVVSLFPQHTWMERPNGLRNDFVNKLSELKPKFIRFPGGLFVEGYTNGTFPVWKESVGPVSERRHFWNIWGYGTSNGMGYHEYLQLCEDLKAEPVYVINSGVTNQERRPRYEVITEMNKLVQDAIDAIEYANAPADSLLGEMRAKNGHPEPFNLKFIEIGSENYGTEYRKRFQLFKEAINKAYPEITVISSSPVSDKLRGEWIDSHLYSNPDFFITNYTRYKQDRPSLNRSSVFIGEMGVTCNEYGGTLKAAIAEACFLIGAEDNPQMVKRIAFAPLLGNADYEINRYPLMLFKKDSIVYTPSYHLLKLFASHRGNQVFPTQLTTYSRPYVMEGSPSIELFDNSYEIKDVKVNGSLIGQHKILSGGWIMNNESLLPAANRWNYVLLGDSGQYNYEFSATIKRTKGSDPIQLRIRDNGLVGEQSNHIGLTMGEEFCHFYHQAGSIKDTLVTPKRFPFESHREYRVSLKAVDDLLQCRINDELIYEVRMKSLPSLVSVATMDEEQQLLLLKVVNTTNHDEITELKIHGVSTKNEIEVIEIKGKPEDKNSFEIPDLITPLSKTHTFKIGMPMIYHFPPNSISLLKIKLD